jgi:nicotinamidase-related amidase
MQINLSDHSRPFLHYLEEWYENLPHRSFADIVATTPPEHIALFSIDMINGFCNTGALASPRVGAIKQSVVAVCQEAYDAGVRAFVLAQDSHSPKTPEFRAFPPHCLAGTPESQTIDELLALPFADDMTIIPKNSLSSELGTTLGEWMTAHPHITTFVIVGDCTDLCVYSAAMFLRLQANALNLERTVLLVAHAIDTYDIPVSVAREAGIYAHDGNLHHVLFLHHMALNGIEVVASVV